MNSPYPLGSGRRTSEFLVALLVGAATLAGVLEGALPAAYGGKIAVVVAGIFTAARVIVKVAAIAKSTNAQTPTGSLDIDAIASAVKEALAAGQDAPISTKK